jgi:hypothetical protein
MAERLAQLQAPQPAVSGEQPTTAASDAQATSQPSSPASASAVSAGLAIDELLHPPRGLRALRLRVWEGMPLLHHPESPDTEAFFDLVTLGIRPKLLEAKDAILDQAADYARTFLNPTDPLNSHNWSARNEFEKADARAAFLQQYAEPLRRLAPRTPFRFAYATAASFGRYDIKRRGFDLNGMGSYALQRADPLQPGGIQLVHGRIGVTPRYDFDMPAAFWPIEEADARAKVERLFGPNDRGERRVQVVTVFDATDADPQTVTLGLQIERLEIWDNALTTRLHSFDVAALRHRQMSDASPLKRLLHPPAALRPWPLGSLDGRPAIGGIDVWQAGFRQSVLAQDLFRLVAAGSIPGYLEDQNNLSSVQHMFSDQVIREVFLGGRGGWAGSDEFAQARARETYYNRYAPALRDLAPRPPFDLVYTQDAMLGQYSAERHAFPVKGRDDSGDFLQRVREGGLVPTPTYSVSNLFWPVDPGRGEAILKTLPNRQAKTAATYEIASLDPSTKRLVIRLKTLSLYTPDLKTRLYEFPVINDPEPYLVAGTPAKLQVAEPAALDSFFFCLKFIEAGGEQVSMKIVGRCSDLVAERDKTFYARSDPWAGLAPDDARLPFFPRGGADRTRSAIARFVEWARIYAASLPATVTAPPSGAIAYGTGLVQVLAEARSPQREHYATFLSENHLQQDQLLSIDSSLSYDGDSVPIVLVLPNRRSLYTMTVPKEALDRHPGATKQSVTSLQIGTTRTIRNDVGRSVLAIDLTPLAIKTFVGDDTLASRSFDDIPRLEGAAVTSPAPQPTASASGTPLPAPAASEAKRKAAKDVRKAALAVFQGETTGPDILGIRLGASYADAEALIRKHMQVGWVLANADAGKSDQITSMRIFVAPDQSEYIALFDSPKHAPERVIGVRRYLKLTKAVSNDAITAMLKEKYGPPVSTNSTVWEWGVSGKPPCQVLGENPTELVVSEGAPMDRSALLQTPTFTIRVAFLDVEDLGKFDVCRPQIRVDRGRYTNGEGFLRVGLFDIRIYATLLRPDGLASPAATDLRIPF